MRLRVLAVVVGAALLSVGCRQEPPPRIAKVSPEKAKFGTVVTVTGEDFGSAPPQKVVNVGPSKADLVLSWADQQITFVVPKVPPGKAEVWVGTGTQDSNRVPFEVDPPEPVLQEIRPEGGRPGETVTLKGTDLGDSPGKAIVGDREARIARWGPSAVEVVIPEGMTGETALVETSLGKRSNALGVSFPRPEIGKFVPRGSLPGRRLMIKGRLFGTAKGTVTVGGKPATVERWTDTQIEVVVPAVPLDSSELPVIVSAQGLPSTPRAMAVPRPPGPGPIGSIEAGAGPFAQVIINELGFPTVLYYRKGEIAAAAWDGFAWQSQPALDHPLLAGEHQGQKIRKAIGWGLRAVASPRGEVDAVMQNESDQSLLWTHLGGGTWSLEPVSTQSAGIGSPGLAIARARDGRPVVALARSDTGAFVFSRTPQGWLKAQVAAFEAMDVSPRTPPADGPPDGFPGGGPRGAPPSAPPSLDMGKVQGMLPASIDIAVDEKGGQHVAFHDPGKGHLKYASGALDRWTVAVADATDGSGGYSSIAAGPSGRLAIAYQNLKKGALCLARPAATGQWETAILDPGPGAGVDADIAFDPKGVLHVVYHRNKADDPRGGSVMYLAYGPAKSKPVLVASGLGQSSNASLALDPQRGTIYITYHNEWTKQICIGTPAPR